MQVDPADRRDELAEAVQACLVRAPVVLVAPVFDQRLHERELAAVPPPAPWSFVRPAHAVEPSTQVGEHLFGHLDRERPWSHRLVSVPWRTPRFSGRTGVDVRSPSRSLAQHDGSSRSSCGSGPATQSKFPGAYSASVISHPSAVSRLHSQPIEGSSVAPRVPSWSGTERRDHGRRAAPAREIWDRPIEAPEQRLAPDPFSFRIARPVREQVVELGLPVDQWPALRASELLALLPPELATVMLGASADDRAGRGLHRIRARSVRIFGWAPLVPVRAWAVGSAYDERSLPLAGAARNARGMGQPPPTTRHRYLLEENRVLKGQLKGRRLRLTHDQRRRRAAKGHRLGRREWTFTPTRPGRPRIMQEISSLTRRRRADRARRPSKRRMPTATRNAPCAPSAKSVSIV